MIRLTSYETGNHLTTFSEIVNLDKRILEAAEEYAAENKITLPYEIHRIAAQLTGCLNRINLCVREAKAKGQKEARVSFNFTHSKYLDVCEKLAANIFNYTISHRDWTKHFIGTAFSDIHGYHEVPTQFEVTWAHVLAGRHPHPLFPKPIERYVDGKLHELLDGEHHLPKL